MPKIVMYGLTRAEVAALLTYCPDTGLLHWKLAAPNRRQDLVAGTMSTNGYWQISILRKTYLAHRVAWLLHYGEWPALQVDHANRDRSDNRIANLRLATLEQQRANTSGWSSLGMPKGVSRHGPGFQAMFRSRAIGTFVSPESAHAAYCKAAMDCYGDYFYSGERSS